MMPLPGWYTRSKWLATFRPADGKGHILISDGVRPAEDIAFDDIVCDKCNADAGAPEADGREGLIYYDGTDSLCRACGRKAEETVLEGVRQTLLRRGWPEFHVTSLKPEVLRAIAHEQAVDDALGTSPADVAKGLRWDCVEAILWASRLLEEVNEHALAKRLFDAVEQRGNNSKEVS